MPRRLEELFARYPSVVVVQSRLITLVTSHPPFPSDIPRAGHAVVSVHAQMPEKPERWEELTLEVYLQRHGMRIIILAFFKL
jgi:hypothetical protein